MESNINSYKLDQEDNEYIFSTSIVGNKLRMSCQNSSSGNNKKFTRDFTIEQLHKIDKIFSFLQSPFEASDYIDKALNNQKVGVSEENGIIKITFYITTNGITNQIEIPLGDSTGSQLLQSEKEVPNFETSNYLGNEVLEQHNIDNLLNSGFTQNNPMLGAEQNYFSQIGNYNTNSNIYENNPTTNSFDLNQFIQQGNNNIDSINQYFQYNEQGASIIGNNAHYNYDPNQFLQSFQNNGSINNNQYGFESKPYITKVENEDNANFEEQIKQLLQESNTNTGTDQLDNDDSLKALSGTKVLPIQTTARVLPPIGPFTSLEGLDLHKLANINAQNNSNILFQPIENTESLANFQNIETENIYKETKSQPILQALNVNIKETNESTVNKDINIETQNLETKAQLSEKKDESEEIKYLKNQLAELEPLRKKVAEMEVLRGQLTELNALRAEVAKFNAFKDEFKEVNSQLEQLSSENEKLKSRVEELEEINAKYEEELKIYKENERIYSMKSRVSNNSNTEDKEEDKDAIYEENSQEMTVKGDIIHDPSELELLTKKINKLNQKLTLNLLYKATADSDKAAAFHAKCDDANSSIVLVETDKGKRFGGYTTCSWRGDCIDKKDEDAFVFSFDKMMTYDNIPGEDAIGCYPKFGPIFLGCQIRIYDNAFTKGGTTFERGLNFDTEEDYELTGGDRSFNVKEIEVYEVIKE